jgi:CO dehydrogenase nickel-insertion accessory protein CooC1
MNPSLRKPSPQSDSIVSVVDCLVERLETLAEYQRANADFAVDKAHYILNRTSLILKSIGLSMGIDKNEYLASLKEEIGIIDTQLHSKPIKPNALGK